MTRRGMSATLTVVITIVVLLVVALILITLVSNNVIKFSDNSGDSIDTTSLGIKCQTELAMHCGSGDSGKKCSGCSSECRDAECP